MPLVQQLFQPCDIFVNWCCTLPFQLFYSYLLQRLCPPRSKRLYWAAIIVVTVCYTIIRPVAPRDFLVVYGLCNAVFVPFAFLGGRLARRIITVACMYLALMAGEMIASLVWVFVADLPTFDNAAAYAHAPLFVFMMLVDAAFVSSVFLLLRRFLDNALPLGGDGAPAPGSVLTFSLALAFFPVLQGAFVMIVIYIAAVFMAEDAPYMVAAGALIAAMGLMDALLFRQMLKYREASLAEQAAQLLERQVGEYLAEVGAVQDRLGALARFRHDLRNNVAVVDNLQAKGAYAEAAMFLAALRATAFELRPAAGSAVSGCCDAAAEGA